MLVISLPSLLLIVVLSAAVSQGQECPLPTTEFLILRIGNLLAAKSGEGTDPVALSLADPHYTCLAQGNNMGRYRHLSVVMNYRTTTGTNMNPRIGQFELDCIASGPGGWQEVSGSLNDLHGNFTEYVNNGTFTNCNDCYEHAGNDHHCVACNPACNVGLMRCTGSSSSDCCAAFESNRMCIDNTNCTTDIFVANEQNNYTCACGLECDPGYTLNSTSCSCYFTDICLRDSPCQNEGTCLLNAAPSNFTCNCTGTGYTGDNCTELIITTTAASSSSIEPITPINLSTSSSSELIGRTDAPSSTGPVRGTSTVRPVTSSSISTPAGRGSPTSSLTPRRVSGDDGPIIAATVISTILGLLLLIILVVVILYILYYYVAIMKEFPGKKDPVWSQAHSNPLYVKPDELLEDSVIAASLPPKPV